MERTIIQRYASSIISGLVQKIDSLSKLDHNLTKGELRELFVSDILNLFLSEQFGIGSGIIMYIPVENRTIFQLKTIPFFDAYLHSFYTNERRIRNDQNEYEAEDYSVQVPGWLYGAQDSTGAENQP